MKSLVFLSVVFSAFLFAPSAQAKDLCKLYANWSPLPKWYDNLCRRGSSAGSMRAVVGGAYSSFADAFNLNPSALPTIPLPVGVEIIGSIPVGGESNPTPTPAFFTDASPAPLKSRVSINAIKGLQGVGFGIATDSDNSIFSNRANHGGIGRYSLVSADSNTPPATSSSVTLAGAMALDRLLSGGMKRFWVPQLGTLFRYNSDQQNWSPGWGASWSIDPVSFGVSFVDEKESEFYPQTSVVTTSIGLRFKSFQAEYASITNTSDFYQSTVTLIAVSGNVFGFMITGAYRGDRNPLGGTSRIYHGAVQYVFTPHLSLAYFYNYVPGYQSLSVQILL